MPVTSVSSEDHFLQLLNDKNYEFTFIDFYALWCAPCIRFAPRLEVLSTKFTNVQFLKVNVDDVEELALRYGITGLPTFLMFERGNTVPIDIPIIGANEEKVQDLLIRTVTSVPVLEEDDF
ncbi:MAG: thioredoxin [Barrevirus sp.]|uniref:Thioredoxin n=1 Tax=Barrevirus sp. TaxID=2487763 RepID=A0A3G4ZQI9_9VIRU|nr:MAG: thioredoxin [Barrevirus sp.]